MRAELRIDWRVHLAEGQCDRDELAKFDLKLASYSFRLSFSVAVESYAIKAFIGDESGDRKSR